MIQALASYKLAAEIAVFGALAAGVVYGVHEFLEHERDIGRAEVRAEYAQKLVEAKDAADKRERELLTQRDEAIQHAQERDQVIRSTAAAANTAALSLRDTLAGIRSSVPSTSADALGKSVSTLSTVLADCTGRYQALAERADRHASDVKTLQDAWPTNGKAQ